MSVEQLKPGYKQTEAGLIPIEWQAVQLGAIGKVIRGASPRPKGDRRFYGGSIPRLMVEDVTRDGKTVIPQVDFLTAEGAKRSRPCPAGTLTVVCSGTVGIPSFLGVDACIHDGFLALIQIDENVQVDYLYHQLTTLQQRFHASATHGGVFTNLTTKSFGAFYVALAPKAEQQSIATALTDVDALLSKLDQLIAKKSDLNQAIVQKLLSGKTRLPGFSEEWEIKRLGDIATITKGRGLSKTAITSSGPRKSILYGELFTTYGRTIKEVIGRTNSFDGTPSKFGDVLMPGSTTTSGVDLSIASALFEDDVALGGDIIVIRPLNTELTNPTFLANYLTSQLKKEIAERTQGITIIHLYGRDLSDLLLPVPAPKEQAAIASMIADLDSDLAIARARREKLSEIKLGMTQELLTGRNRLA